MARFCWLMLGVLVLIGCGQPLQINTPSARATLVAATPASAGAATVPAAAGPTPIVTSTLEVATTIAPGEGATPVTILPTTPSIMVVPITAVPLNNEQRWRAQQLDRVAFEAPRVYVANQPVSLFWFDPATGQTVEIGSIVGEFAAQAQFTLRSSNQPALEVPYRINNDFGLTAISEALRDRMRAVGYTNSVEAYITLSEPVTPKQ